MSSTFLNSFPAKVLRILLVFVLTFGMTLHVEYFAFAADTGKKATEEKGAKAEETKPKEEPKPKEEAAPKVTALKVYEGANSKSGSAIRLSGQDQAQTPVIDVHQGNTEFCAYALVDGEEVDASDDVSWDIDSDLANIGGSTGEMIATGAGNGTVTVTCTLSAADAKDLAAGSTDGKKVSFKVNIKNQVPAYVKSVQICDDGGSPISSLELAADEGSYDFHAKVVACYAGDGDTLEEYTCTPGKGLSDWDDDFHDLVWSVESDGAATISKSTGELEMNDATAATVTCESVDGFPGGSLEPSTVTVMKAAAEDPKEHGETGKGESFIKKLTILDEEGAALGAGDSIEVAAGDTYRFGAEAVVTSVAKGNEKTDTTFALDAGGTWKLKDAGTVAGGGEAFPFEVSWDAGGLKIEDGFLTMEGEDPVTVTCSSASGENGAPVSVQVTVKSPEKEPEEAEPAKPATVGVQDVTILKDDGSAIEEQPLRISIGEGEDAVEYPFSVRVSVMENEDAEVVEYVRANGVWQPLPGDATAELLDTLAWTIGDEDKTNASIDSEGTLALARGAAATVTCSVSGKTATVRATTVAAEPEAPSADEDPAIESVQILKEDGGAAFADGEPPLELVAKEGEPASYGFGAIVSVLVAGNVVSYQWDGHAWSSSEDTGAQSADEAGDAASPSSPAGENPDVLELPFSATWSADTHGKAGASIDNATGLLTLTETIPVTVTFTATTEKGEPKGKQVEVNADAKEATEPYIRSLSILKADGGAFDDLQSKTLELKADASASTSQASSSPSAGGQADNDRVSYEFGLRVTVVDPQSEDTADLTLSADGWRVTKPGTTTLKDLPAFGNSADSTSGDKADAVRALLDDIRWSVESEGTASMDGSALSMEPGTKAVVTCTSFASADGEPLQDQVAVNVSGEELGPSYETGLHLSYTPAPEGRPAFISSFLTGVSNITYITHWEEREPGGEWHPTEPEIGGGDTGAQNLQRPTAKPYIGREYRAYIDIVNKSDTSIIDIPRAFVSEVATITVGELPYVELDVKYVPEGQDAWFYADAVTDGAHGKIANYVWYEFDKDNVRRELTSGKLAETYQTPTIPEKYGYRYQVRIETEKGYEAWSNIQMLAALDSYQNGPESENPDPAPSSSSEGDGETEGGSSSSTGSESGSSSSSSKASSSTSSESAPASSSSASSASSASSSASFSSSSSASTSSSSAEEEPPSNDDDQPTPDEPHEMVDPAETLSQQVDRTGQATVSFDDGSTAVMKPAGSVKMANDSKSDDDIVVDPQVSEEVSQLRQEQREVELSSQPGARWNPLTFKNTTPELQEVLESNPFAPLVLPFVLGLLAAGALEKYLRYREQKRPSQAVFR